VNPASTVANDQAQCRFGQNYIYSHLTRTHSGVMHAPKVRRPFNSNLVSGIHRPISVPLSQPGNLLVRSPLSRRSDDPYKATARCVAVPAMATEWCPSRDRTDAECMCSRPATLPRLKICYAFFGVTVGRATEVKQLMTCELVLQQPWSLAPRIPVQWSWFFAP
jgi:hypothetical protein